MTEGRLLCLEKKRRRIELKRTNLEKQIQLLQTELEIIDENTKIIDENTTFEQQNLLQKISINPLMIMLLSVLPYHVVNITQSYNTWYVCENCADYHLKDFCPKDLFSSLCTSPFEFEFQSGFTLTEQFNFPNIGLQFENENETELVNWILRNIFPRTEKLDYDPYRHYDQAQADYSRCTIMKIFPLEYEIRHYDRTFPTAVFYYKDSENEENEERVVIYPK